MDPQNPYISPLVEASAGSGKTYQLSQRFLNLVSAGAKPSSILTITFTVKAAGEMRSRIIAEATKLLHRESTRKDFDHRMATFRQQAQRQGLNPLPPLSAEETAKEILSATQTLKISTIDSLFHAWVSTFPWESHQKEDGDFRLPNPYRIMDEWEREEIQAGIWKRFFRTLQQVQEGSYVESLLAKTDRGTLTIDKQLGELDRYHGFIWQLAREGREILHPHGLPRIPPTWQEEGSFLEAHQADFLHLMKQTSQGEKFAAALRTKSLKRIQESGFLTKTGTISGTYLKGKKREMLLREILELEEAIHQHEAWHKLGELNGLGAIFFEVYEHWQKLAQEDQRRTGVIGFGDLTKACYRLFTSDWGLGATWLIQKQVSHLLIDEFQDTSLLQWAIFERLGRELLSGQGTSAEKGILPTAFIVGDRKQSIYGFREAEPIVMDLARATFADMGGFHTSLTQSYRTAQVVFDYLNRLFPPLLPTEYSPHHTAQMGGQPVIPNVGRVLVSPLFSSPPGEDPSPTQKEAQFIARTLGEALKRPELWPVFDKESGKFRPLEARDCGVLYRSTTHADVFEEAIRAEGLKTRREERKGFFQRREIQDLMALLRYLAFPVDELSLLTFLRSPLAGWEDTKLLTLLTRLKEGDSGSSQGRSERLWGLLTESYPEFCERIQGFLKRVNTQPPYLLLADLFRQLGVLGDTEQGFAHLNSFQLLDVCHKLAGDGVMTLASLVLRLESLSQVDGIGVAGGGQDAINLMTIHKAKGLEFPLVVVLEAFEPWFQSDLYWLKVNSQGSRGIAYVGRKDQRPEHDLGFGQTMDAAESQQKQESIRLLYVALTRASQYLVISGHKSAKKPVGLFYPAIQDAQEELGRKNPDGSWMSETGIASVSWRESSRHPENNSRHPEYLCPPQTLRLKDLTLVTPHGELSRVRSQVRGGRQQYAQEIGQFIHRGLELLLKGQPWDRAVAQRVWRTFRLPEGALFDEAFEEVLANFEALLPWRVHPYWSEVPLIYRRGSYLMRGVADFVARTSEGQFCLMDFKTVQTSISDPEGLRELMAQHRYDRQLQWYKGAWEAIYPGCLVTAGVWFTQHRVFQTLDSFLAPHQG